MFGHGQLRARDREGDLWNGLFADGADPGSRCRTRRYWLARLRGRLTGDAVCAGRKYRHDGICGAVGRGVSGSRESAADAAAACGRQSTSAAECTLFRQWWAWARRIGTRRRGERLRAWAAHTRRRTWRARPWMRLRTRWQMFFLPWKHALGSVSPALHADGGATRNNALMQFQADILGRAGAASRNEELSAIGAAWLAGLRWDGGAALRRWNRLPHAMDTFTPTMNEAERDRPGPRMEDRRAAYAPCSGGQP